METLIKDIRYALRQLHKRLGFTAVAVITLALGVGASTAIFSVVYGVLLRPLPYSDPNRIMAVFEVTPKGEWNRLADPNFDDFRDQNHSFEAIAKYSAGIASVSGAGQPTRSMVANVSADFLNVFRVQPTVGRGFVPADMKKGAAPVVLVSYGYWRQNLSSRTDLSQLHLKIDNAIYSVIGVLPDTFEFPSETALWIPADTDGENPSRTSHNYSAVARLRDGVTSEQANA
ncbi:MAG: ABC transporter permease, partial [Candidatus Sulfotelmatobacter sp.]